MASPFTAYLAGMGTVVAALTLGFSTTLMLIGPATVQKEQPPALQKRADIRPVEPGPAIAGPQSAISPVITAAQTPIISTAFAVPPPLWPPSARSTTGQSSREPELAPDPGVRQIPVRPALSAEAAVTAAPAANAREAVHNPDAAEAKKKKKSAQRKPRGPLVDQQGFAVAGTRASGYAPERRAASSPGIFDILLGRN